MKHKIVSTPSSSISSTAYLLPENFDDTNNISRRAIYLDTVLINSTSKKLIETIEIPDGEVKDIIKGIVNNQTSKQTKYKLIYFNYWDETENKVKLKAESLVVLNFATKNPETLIINVIPCNTSEPRVLPLEIILDSYPENIVFYSNQIFLDTALFQELYTPQAKISETALQTIKETSHLVADEAALVAMTRPNKSLLSSYSLFKEAIKNDPIYANSAIGNAISSVGEGILEGLFLLSILNQAQNEYKVAALIGFLTKLSILFSVYGNTKSSKDVGIIEAKERLGKALDKLFPLWEMGENYETLKTLINKHTHYTTIALISSLTLFSLYPPIFNYLSQNLGNTLQISVFTSLFILSQFLYSYAASGLENISFKIARDRVLDNEENSAIKNNFWSIAAFEDNIALILYNLALLVGFGAYVLLEKLTLGFEAGLLAGALAILISAARYVLPLFGHDENTALDINSAYYLREGNLLKFSNGIAIELNEDGKTEIIEMPEHNITRILDFDSANVKIHLPKGLNPTGMGRFLKFIMPRQIPFKYPFSLKSSDGSQYLSFYRWNKPYSKTDIKDLVCTD